MITRSMIVQGNKIVLIITIGVKKMNSFYIWIEEYQLFDVQFHQFIDPNIYQLIFLEIYLVVFRFVYLVLILF